MTSLQERLFAMQDKQYAAFQAKLTPGVPVESFIGIRVPVLRKFIKEFTKESECKDFLHQLPHEYYDENMLHGLLISEVKDYAECIRLTDRFLPFVDNWAVCDIMSPKVFGKHKEELLAKIKTWSKSSHVYTCRFGIETLMSHYLDKDFKAEHLEIPASIKERRVLRKNDGSLVLRHRPCQAMGPGDSLHRATPPCSLDAQQDHPEDHRELQNHARAEGISADIEDKIIMKQDTSTYYVWIGGSCDYGHKERAGGAAVVIEHNGNIISRDVISDLHTTEFRMMLTLMVKVMQEIPEGSDILFLTNAAYIQNFDKTPTVKSANPDLIIQCIEEKKRHNSVGVKIVQYHKSSLLIETHDRATEAMAKTRKEFHQKNK
jgi:3-methyladenine DNA glycosylase AlkD